MSKKKCSGLSLNNVACSCALKMIFLSLPYNIHQRTLQKLQECVVLKGTAYHSHSAPYQSDMITAQLKLFLSLFFFFLFLFSHKMSLRICKLFHFGIQRQASKSTVVKKKAKYLNQLPFTLKSEPYQQNKIIVTSPCTFVYSYLQFTVVVHMHIYTYVYIYTYIYGFGVYIAYIFQHLNRNKVTPSS